MLTCKDVAELLRSWDDILILCHVSPDGDALGSACGLAGGLASLGKRAGVFCADSIPQKFDYLFSRLPGGRFEPRHVLTVDVAGLSLLGDAREQYEGRIELAIDHHATHAAFVESRWVEPESAATAEMVYLLLLELGVTITPFLADCIYTGLTTDTGCFRYRNVTARTHRIAAKMLEAGADAGEINRVMFECKSRAQAEAERRALSGMEYFCQGKCAMIRLPQSLYGETGAKESELDGVAALPRQIEGVLVGITMKEKADGTVKASVRTNLPADSAAICARFGGGGHAGAAGCSFPGLSLEQAAAQMRKACEEYLEGLL